MKSAKLYNEVALKTVLDEHNLDALIVVSPKNVFYYSGSPIARTELLIGYWPTDPGRSKLTAVVVPANGNHILVCPEEEEDVNREGAWIGEICSYQPYRESPMQAVARAIKMLDRSNGRFGIEGDYLTKAYRDELQDELPGASFIHHDREFEWIRSLKTPGEIKQLKEAADLIDDAMFDAFSSARVGDTEWEIHCRIIEGAMARGAEHCRGFIAAGVNNDINFYGTNHKPFEPGDMIHTDYAAFVNGYPGHVSRLAVVGEPHHIQRKKYANLLAVERRIIEFMRPGVRGKDVFQFARDAFYELGYIHTAPILGHNLGLGYHERPMLTAAEDMVLEATNVVALEPLSEWTFHIQDHVLIEEQGARLQSDKFDTRELFVIG